jgi:pimeloyl-ACP methyl ester carboxylesterase
MTWLTNTGVSSARLYWESKLALFAPKALAIPVAVSAFPDELYQAPRSWTERAYPKRVYYNKLDKGAHCAALEQPQLFATEMRAAFNRYGSRMHTTERVEAERAVHRGVV